MSSLLKKWSTYVTNWRKANGYSKTKFTKAAGMDMRALRDIEGHHFHSRFYSVASTVEYIRHANLIHQLQDMDVENPELYLPLIEKMDSLPPSRRSNIQNLFIEHFQMQKEKQIQEAISSTSNRKS